MSEASQEFVDFFCSQLIGLASGTKFNDLYPDHRGE